MYSLGTNQDPYAQSLARALRNTDLLNPEEDEQPAFEEEHPPSWEAEDPFFCAGEHIAQ